MFALRTISAGNDVSTVILDQKNKSLQHFSLKGSIDNRLRPIAHPRPYIYSALLTFVEEKDIQFGATTTCYLYFKTSLIAFSILNILFQTFPFRTGFVL